MILDGLHSWCKPCTKLYDRERFSNNKDKFLQQGRDYYQDNKEAIIEKAAHYVARRRKSRPSWADSSKIRQLHLEVKRLRKLGINVEADHIDPINHQLVCELDVPENIGIVLAAENKGKFNSFIPYRIDFASNYYQLKGDI